MSAQLNIDDPLAGGWPVWKHRAEQSGLTKILSPVALMLLWCALGHNCWLEQRRLR